MRALQSKIKPVIHAVIRQHGKTDAGGGQSLNFVRLPPGQGRK